jgi:hypothetical protein
MRRATPAQFQRETERFTMERRERIAARLFHIETVS